LPPTRPTGSSGAPTAAVAVNPSTIASPAQIQAILAQVVFVRPDLVAFFGCLYYAALRPEEAVALRRSDLILPPCTWPREDDPHHRLPTHWHRLDQHRQAA
jgi:integrase